MPTITAPNSTLSALKLITISASRPPWRFAGFAPFQSFFPFVHIKPRLITFKNSFCYSRYASWFCVYTYNN